MNIDATEEGRAPEVPPGASASWTLFAGILTLILGIAAVSLPLLAALTVVMVLGWVFIIQGVTGVFRAMGGGRGSHRVAVGLVSLAYLVTGLLLLKNLDEGVLAFTLVLAGLLLLHALSEIYLGWDWRPGPGWGWRVGSGVLGVVVAVLVFARFPYSAEWFIGLAVGVKLMVSGWALIAAGGGGLREASD